MRFPSTSPGRIDDDTADTDADSGTDETTASDTPSVDDIQREDPGAPSERGSASEPDAPTDVEDIQEEQSGPPEAGPSDADAPGDQTTANDPPEEGGSDGATGGGNADANGSDPGVFDVIEDASETYTEEVAEPVGEFIGDTSPVSPVEQAVFGTDTIDTYLSNAGTSVAQIGNVPGAIVGARDTAAALDEAYSTAYDPVVIGGVPTGIVVPDPEGQQEVGEQAVTTAEAAAAAAADNPVRTAGSVTGAVVGGAAGGAALSRGARGARSLSRSDIDVDDLTPDRSLSDDNRAQAQLTRQRDRETQGVVDTGDSGRDPAVEVDFDALDDIDPSELSEADRQLLEDVTDQEIDIEDAVDETTDTQTTQTTTQQQTTQTATGAADDTPAGTQSTGTVLDGAVQTDTTTGGGAGAATAGGAEIVDAGADDLDVFAPGAVDEAEATQTTETTQTTDTTTQDVTEVITEDDVTVTVDDQTTDDVVTTDDDTMTDTTQDATQDTIQTQTGTQTGTQPALDFEVTEPEAPRRPRLDPFDGTDDADEFDLLEADDATFENPTRSLEEVSDDLTEGFDAP